MPLYFICIIILCFAGLVGITEGLEYKKRKKKREAIEKSFGRIPASFGKKEEEVLPPGVDTLLQLEPLSPTHWEVDDRTWEDLELDRVFCRINLCQSGIGESVLYGFLRRPGAFGGELWEKTLAYFRDHPEDRLKVQLLFARMGKKSPFLLGSLLDSGDPRPSLPFPWIYWPLTLFPFLAISLFFLSIPLGVVAVVGGFGVNIVVHYLLSRRIQNEFLGTQQFLSLLRICRKLKRLVPQAPYIPELEDHLPPVTAFSFSAPLGARRGNSDMDLLTEYSSAILLRDLRAYQKTEKLMERYRPALRRLFFLAGMVDASISTLSFQASLPLFCTPTFSQENALVFQDIYHPLLRSPVTNSGTFHAGTLLTGSNASGKSTFLKALAINAILAQSLGLCACAALTLRPGPILSSMALRDQLSEGESYFVVELRSLLRILDEVTIQPCLCFIDEILRGTNTVERIAAATAVLHHLSRRDCLCVAATHDLELAAPLEHSYAVYHFSETVSPQDVTFDYLLKPGLSPTRNALLLMEHMHFPASLVAEAKRNCGNAGTGALTPSVSNKRTVRL